MAVVWCGDEGDATMSMTYRVDPDEAFWDAVVQVLRGRGLPVNAEASVSESFRGLPGEDGAGVVRPFEAHLTLGIRLTEMGDVRGVGHRRLVAAELLADSLGKRLVDRTPRTQRMARIVPGTASPPAPVPTAPRSDTSGTLDDAAVRFGLLELD